MKLNLAFPSHITETAEVLLSAKILPQIVLHQETRKKIKKAEKEIADLEISDCVGGVVRISVKPEKLNAFLQAIY